jgi:Predicted oxidoreductases (related to aryl-alcohol dehydrogenases)
LKYVRLGKSGPKVSAVGIGMWEIGSRLWGGSVEVARGIVTRAAELGVNLFDTAEVYGGGRSERALGEAVREAGLRTSSGSEQVAGFSLGYSSSGAEGIKRRLGFAPALLQLHWPPPTWIPLCAPLRGLEKAVKAGLAEYVGLSNFSGALLEEALHCFSLLEPVSDQVEYNLAYRTPELDVFKVTKANGLGVIAYSPLAKGALAGSPGRRSVQTGDRHFRAASGDANLLSAVKEIADRHKATMAQVALAWIVAKGAVPIPGTTKPERAAELASAAELALSDEEVARLDKASEKYLTLWGKGVFQHELHQVCALRASVPRHQGLRRSVEESYRNHLRWVKR